MPDRQAIATKIAHTIENYSKVQVTDLGNLLRIKDIGGNVQIPIRSAKTANISISTFR